MKRAALVALSMMILTSYLSAKTKQTVITIQLVASESDESGLLQNIFLILPDGSHAMAQCGTLQKMCGLEPFAPEKRKEFPCFLSDHSITHAQCFDAEPYYAVRAGNEIGIKGGSGPMQYHITGSWGEFIKGTIPAPTVDPVWTAICKDDHISYSKERSGTCADHGGVKVWRVPE